MSASGEEHVKFAHKIPNIGANHSNIFRSAMKLTSLVMFTFYDITRSEACLHQASWSSGYHGVGMNKFGWFTSALIQLGCEKSCTLQAQKSPAPRATVK